MSATNQSDELTQNFISDNYDTGVREHSAAQDNNTQLELPGFSDDDATNTEANIPIGSVTIASNPQAVGTESQADESLAVRTSRSESAEHLTHVVEKQEEVPLQAMDWTSLQHRFAAAMQQKSDEEAEILGQLARLMAVCSRKHAIFKQS